MVPQGDKVVVDLQTANRDTSVFGDDAAEFNPLRAVQGRISPAACPLVAACMSAWYEPRRWHRARDGESPKPDNHQFGTITLIIKELIERGMRPNPDQAPQKIEASERDVWAIYPVLF